MIISAIPDSASGSCPGGYLCLFSDSNFGGSQLTMGPYKGCKYYDLHNYYDDHGHPWANEASSIDNPAPRPGPAYFYHNSRRVFSVGGGHYLKDLSKDYGTDGHVLNDYITSVYTC